MCKYRTYLLPPQTHSLPLGSETPSPRHSLVSPISLLTTSYRKKSCIKVCGYPFPGIQVLDRNLVFLKAISLGPSPPVLCLLLDSIGLTLFHGSPRHTFWEPFGGAWSLSFLHTGSHPSLGICCCSEPCLDRCLAVWIRRESLTKIQRRARGVCGDGLPSVSHSPCP